MVKKSLGWPHLLLALLLSYPPLCPAMSDVHAKVQYKDGRYRVDFGVLLEADPATVRSLMKDYVNWPTWSASLESVKLVEVVTKDQYIVDIVFDSCVFIFCQNIKKREKVTVLNNGDIITVTDPEHSDFKYAHEHWEVKEDQGKTRLRYESEMVPNFFVPPLFGPSLVKRQIRLELERSSHTLEQLANPVR